MTLFSYLNQRMSVNFVSKTVHINLYIKTTVRLVFSPSDSNCHVISKVFSFCASLNTPYHFCLLANPVCISESLSKSGVGQNYVKTTLNVDCDT